MKLIALVTLVTKAGEIPPGAQVDVKDAAEAKSLVARGFAAVPAKTSSESALPPEVGNEEGQS